MHPNILNAYLDVEKVANSNTYVILHWKCQCIGV